MVFVEAKKDDGSVKSRIQEDFDSLYKAEERKVELEDEGWTVTGIWRQCWECVSGPDTGDVRTDREDD